MSTHHSPVAPVTAATAVRPNPTRIALDGELDLACAARLDRMFRRLERTPGPVDVDLGAVTFADTHGLAPILNSAQRRRDRGVPLLHLVDVSPPVAWLLDLLGSPLGTPDGGPA